MNLKRLLSAAAVCGLFLVARNSFADTLKLVSTGTETAGGYYVYPYNFSVDGSKTTTSLMCMNFDREITLNEQWAVSIHGLSMDPTDVTAIKYRAEAYLFSELGGTTDAAAIQFAAWEIFDGAVTSNPAWKSSYMTLATTALAKAVDPALTNSNFFSQFQIYTPLTGSPYDQTWTAGKPQEFIGRVAPTPEPSSMMLLGTGLLASGFMLRRRKTTRGGESLPSEMVA